MYFIEGINALAFDKELRKSYFSPYSNTSRITAYLMLAISAI